LGIQRHRGDPGASMRVKRLIGRPQESTQSERRSTPRFEKGHTFLFVTLISLT